MYLLIGFLLNFVSTIMSTVTRKVVANQLRRLASIDMGSGTLKLQIADVDTQRGLVRTTIFGEERPCAFGADVLKSSNNCLSPEIQDKGIKTLASFREICEEEGVEEISAVATAVFRKAQNGAEYLLRLRQLFKFPFSIVSQEEEAKLGYLSAVAALDSFLTSSRDRSSSSSSSSTTTTTTTTSDSSTTTSRNTSRTSSIGNDEEEVDDEEASNNPDRSREVGKSRGPSKVVAWDSGGGSFQITTSSGESLDKHGESPFKSYMGHFGSSYANRTLVETVQGRKQSEVHRLNPIPLDDAYALADVLRSEMDTNVPDWLNEAELVVAIGGPNSVFQLICSVLTVMKRERSGSFGTETTEESIASSDRMISTFTLADVDAALMECCGKDDEYLSRYLSYPHADPTTIIVPKLSLVKAVMTHTKIQRVLALPTIGSCGGMFITPHLWGSGSDEL